MFQLDKDNVPLAVAGCPPDGFSTVTATAKKTNAIKCYGTMELNEEAALSAKTSGAAADIFCHGALVNYGAAIDAEMDILGGIHDLIRE